MFNALMAALPAMLQLIEAGVDWLKASQAHTDDQRHAALLELEARLLTTVAKVQAARPQQPASTENQLPSSHISAP